MPTRSFPESSGKPKTSGTPIYGSRSRVLPGGSKWLSALPTGSRWESALPTGSRWLSALPTGSEWSSAQPTEPLSRLWRQLPFQGRLDCADRASPERGGACDVGSGVLKRRIRELQFMAPGFVERMRGSECVQAQPARKTKKSTAPMYGGRFRVLSGGSKWLSAQPTGSQWESALPTCRLRP